MNIKFSNLSWTIVSCILLFRCSESTVRTNVVFDLNDVLYEAAKNKILSIHNEERARLRASATEYPNALYMPDFVWDDSLADSAKSENVQCTMAHLNNFPVGENIAGTIVSMSADASKSEVEDMAVKRTNSWLKEKDAYTYTYDAATGKVTEICTPISEKNTDSCGHYTQMIWADSVKIGCSLVSQCSYEKDIVTKLTCHYSPASNYDAVPFYPYEELPSQATGDSCLWVKCNAYQPQANGIFYKDGDILKPFPSQKESKHKIGEYFGGLWEIYVLSGKQAGNLAGWCWNTDPFACTTDNMGDAKAGLWSRVNCEAALSALQSGTADTTCAASTQVDEEDKVMMGIPVLPNKSHIGGNNKKDFFSVLGSVSWWVWLSAALVFGIVTVMVSSCREKKYVKYASILDEENIPLCQ